MQLGCLHCRLSIGTGSANRGEHWSLLWSLWRCSEFPWGSTQRLGALFEPSEEATLRNLAHQTQSIQMKVVSSLEGWKYFTLFVSRNHCSAHCPGSGVSAVCPGIATCHSQARGSYRPERFLYKIQVSFLLSHPPWENSVFALCSQKLDSMVGIWAYEERVENQSNHRE